MPVSDVRIEERSWIVVIAEMTVAVLTFFAIFANRSIEEAFLRTIPGDAIAYMLLATLYTFCGTSLLYFWNVGNSTDKHGRPAMIVFMLGSYALAAWYLIQIVIVR